MPLFAGLTRDEEEDKEEHAKEQLLSLLHHKNEHLYFSEMFQDLIEPNFKPKKDHDPDWRPGARKLTKHSKPRRKPPAAAAPTPAVPLRSPSSPPPAAVLVQEEEEEPSTNLADYAAFFA